MVWYMLLFQHHIWKLKDEFPYVTSPWYACGGMAAATLKYTLIYSKSLCKLGSLHGYFPRGVDIHHCGAEENIKTAAAVKRESIAVVQIENRHRYMGGYFGDMDLERGLIEDTMEECVEAVECI